MGTQEKRMVTVVCCYDGCHKTLREVEMVHDSGILEDGCCEKHGEQLRKEMAEAKEKKEE